MTDTNLYKVSKVCWAVTSNKTEEAQVFTSVDTASDYLLSIGVDDDHIDLALIDMVARGTTRANFGINGMFVFSDNARLNDKLGVA